MITPNGGVFGRNPKFNNVTVDGNLTVNGDIALGDDIVVADSLTVQGTGASTSTTNGALVVAGGAGIGGAVNAGADSTVNGLRVGRGGTASPSSNVSIGLNAGALLNDAATGNTLVGNVAGDAIVAGRDNTAFGSTALSAMSAPASVISNTTAGTNGLSGGSGTVAGVTLEKDSGTGTMTVYPTVTLTIVSGAVTAISITSRGSGATVQSGLVMKATAAGIALGAPSDWRGTLTVIGGECTAIGANALQVATGLQNTALGANACRDTTSGDVNTAIGAITMISNTTGTANTAVGHRALQANTTGGGNVAIGSQCLQNGTKSQCTGVGVFCMVDATGSDNSAFGYLAGRGLTSGHSNVFVGAQAGWRVGTGTSTAQTNTTSVMIGYDSRGSADGNTNEVVIAGTAGRGNGSNTVTLGNSSTTGTYMAGTATSLFSIAGDTMRITGTRNPASNAAGTAGDFCFGSTGGNTYLYYCIASGNWGRVQLTTGY